ncbi:hypothetical protein SDC9_96688 [bioreactor metagenome]|uniref:Uncharacterized protein n=1 Tax=bioreactor metagenome TaxID=1076179 RepID=A0A645AJW3_9ZZZZ
MELYRPKREIHKEDRRLLELFGQRLSVRTFGALRSYNRHIAAIFHDLGGVSFVSGEKNALDIRTA